MFNIWPPTEMKICQLTFFAQNRSKLCQVAKSLSKIMPNTFKILPNLQNFAKSGHTAVGSGIGNSIFWFFPFCQSEEVVSRQISARERDDDVNISAFRSYEARMLVCEFFSTFFLDSFWALLPKTCFSQQIFFKSWKIKSKSLSLCCQNF